MVPNNLSVKQQWRNRHREQTHGHGERGREGEMYGESNTETYITVCKIANGNCCMSQETCTPMADSCQCMTKTTTMS